MRFAAVSEKGGRGKNEDALNVMKRGGIYCFVLADGLGGQGSGEVASRLAVKTVLECFAVQPEISAQTVHAYLQAAQNAICEERSASPQNANMATTITVLVSDGNEAVWAHCGDSRIYRFRKHLIQEITDDHSVAFASFMAGDISYDDIRVSPDQNKLLRTLSDGNKFRPDITGPVKVDKNTRFLMCSDGLWEYVHEDYMEKTMKKSRSPNQWLDGLLKIRDASAPADADNYSAIAIFV